MLGEGSLIVSMLYYYTNIKVLKFRLICLEDLLEGKNSQGMTPLFQAVSCNNLECVQYLVTSGANIDTRDNVGRTPVALAAYQVLLQYTIMYKMYMLWSSFCFVLFSPCLLL